MDSFLDILLEAPTPKKAKVTKLKAEPEEKPTDYTNEEEPDEPEETDTDDAEPDEEEPTDYTEEEDESDPETDGADPGEEVDADGEEPTDYTAEEEENPEDPDGSGDESGTEETPEEGETEQDPNEKENLRILMEDFSNLYFLVKNTITKLSNVDKSNILINKIVSQISSNLNVLKKQLFDFISFTFAKGTYVTNLYKYNYYLEAFKLNVQMLKKISIFVPN